MEVGSYKQLLASWMRAQADRSQTVADWRQQLDNLQFAVSIRYRKSFAERVPLLQTTLRGVDAVPATDFEGVWPSSYMSEGLGWTVTPAPGVLKAMGVVTDKGKAAYRDSIQSLEKTDMHIQLHCSCSIVRNEPQAVGMLVRGEFFDETYNDDEQLDKIYFLIDNDTSVRIYLALDFSGEEPQWRLLLDVRLELHEGDLKTDDAVKEIMQRVHWHE